MEMNPESFMAAANGTKVQNTTSTASTLNAAGLFFPEDTVVTSLKVNGAAVDIKANYISTAATAVKANVTLTAKGDDYFSEITFSSGSCVEILRS